jgi:hypothetical protein
MFLFRSGFAFGKISADDKHNRQKDLKDRNLNFKTLIWEFNVCTEVNIMDPEVNDVYPYFFGGAGLFRFNPYTYDKNNQKAYLHPLSTEGQGLPQYPDRKEYSLTQFCLPFGFGLKANVRNKYILGVEFGMRYLFTDYLDDVSGTYVDYETLVSERGLLAGELASRIKAYIPPFGDTRGNPKAKDKYCFGGIKVAFFLGKDNTIRTPDERAKKVEKKDKKKRKGSKQ